MANDLDGLEVLAQQVRSELAALQDRARSLVGKSERLAVALLRVDEQRREMVRVLRTIENWNAEHVMGWVPMPLQDMARECLATIEMCSECGQEPSLMRGRCAGCGVLP